MNFQVQADIPSLIRRTLFLTSKLVYDQCITVPDYTVYIETGVTAALAWELPSKPTYPEYELMQQYESGKLPLIEYRKDKNVTNSNSTGAINVSESNHTSNHQSSNFLDEFYKNSDLNRALWNYLQRRQPDSYYFGDSTNNYVYNYTVHAPYAPNYDTYNHYTAFTEYLIDKYLKPSLNPNQKAPFDSTTNAPT